MGKYLINCIALFLVCIKRVCVRLMSVKNTLYRSDTSLSVLILNDQRKRYAPRDFSQKHNTFKLEKLVNSNDTHTIFNLIKFCTDILNIFKEIY